VGPLITQRFDAGAQGGCGGLAAAGGAWQQDRLIQPRAGPQAVRAATADPKRFVLVEGGSHHNTNSVGQPLYREAMARLFGLKP
jgi:hypothetical protein